MPGGKLMLRASGMVIAMYEILVGWKAGEGGPAGGVNTTVYKRLFQQSVFLPI